MRLADLEAPRTPACRAAVEVAQAYCSPGLFNHSVRAYLWAAAHASSHDIGFDAELLYVAALLHDLALVEEFDSHALPFEEAGGHIAWLFGAAARWPVDRRQRVGEIIVRHMWDEVDPKEDPEGYLLELSTSIDVSGRSAETIDVAFRAEVLARFPRLGFGEEIIAHFENQAERKPTCLAARFVHSGFARRVRHNPLDR